MYMMMGMHWLLSVTFSLVFATPALATSTVQDQFGNIQKAVQNQPQCVVMGRFRNQEHDEDKRVFWVFQATETESIRGVRCPALGPIWVLVPGARFETMPDGREILTLRSDMGTPAPNSLYLLRLRPGAATTWSVIQTNYGFQYIPEK